MVGVEAALEIRVLHRHGKSIREIARETGVARNTVRRYLRDEEAARYKPRPPRSTKLDPFKAYVAERLGSAVPEWIPASVLLMELRERGYCGGYTMLKRFVATNTESRLLPRRMTAQSTCICSPGPVSNRITGATACCGRSDATNRFSIV